MKSLLPIILIFCPSKLWKTVVLDILFKLLRVNQITVWDKSAFSPPKWVAVLVFYIYFVYHFLSFISLSPTAIKGRPVFVFVCLLAICLWTIGVYWNSNHWMYIYNLLNSGLKLIQDDWYRKKMALAKTKTAKTQSVLQILSKTLVG